MTDSRIDVFVPYWRFLERQERRHRIAAELARRDQPPSIDADVMLAPAEMASAQPGNNADD